MTTRSHQGAELPRPGAWGDSLPALIPVALLTVTLAYRLNVWVDEAYTLDTTGGGLIHALRQAIHFELQSPGYFVLLSLWRLPSDSYFWARGFSLLCLLLTLPLLARLCRAYLPGLHPRVVVLALGAHGLCLYAALELRSYALVLLLTALLMWLFHLGYLVRAHSQWARWLYLAVAVAAVYTQYYLGFLLVAHGATLLALRAWRPLLRFVFGMAGVALALLPLAWVVPAQVGGYSFTQVPLPWPLAIKGLYWRLGDYLFPLEPEALRPIKIWGQRLFMLGLGAGLVVALMRRRLFQGHLLTLLTTCGVLSLLILPLIKVYGEEMVGARHTIFLLFPLLLFCLALLHEVAGHRATAVASALLLLSSAVSAWDRYSGLAKDGDWIRVARYIQAAEKPAQPLLVFKPQSALALKIHYQGKNKVIPVPGATSLVTWEPAKEALKSPAQIDAALAAAGPGELWVVTDNGLRYMGIDYNHALLERYLKDRYDPVSSRAFYGARVRLMRRRAGRPGAQP